MNINEFSINSLKTTLDTLGEYEDCIIYINNKKAYQIGISGDIYFIMYNRYSDIDNPFEDFRQKQLGTSQLLEGVVFIMFKHYLKIIHKI